MASHQAPLRWPQTAFLTGAWGGYVLLFVLLFPLAGAGFAALAVIPVVVSAWQRGLTAGLLAGVLSFPLNTLLLNLVGYQPGGWDVVIRGGGAPGSIALVLIGAVVGRLHDLSEEVKRRLAERQQAEEALRKTKEQLEVRVTARTVELSHANELLQRELSERQRTEQALRASEQRYRGLIEASPDAIAVTDLNTNITIVNHQVLILLGYASPEELIGKNALELIAPEERARAVENTLQTLQTGRVRNVEYTLIKKDGSRVPVELSASLIVDGEGTSQAFTAVVRDITERKRVEQELRYLSTHDTLTGLYNRAYFEEEMARLEKGRQFPMSIVVADVDGLKAINDDEGHAAGDELLQRVAVVLKSSCRAEDVVARIGGDEFAVLLPVTDAMTAEAALARIRQTLTSVNTAENRIPISFSLGRATADSGEKLVEAMRRADESMYRDKFARLGRNRSQKP